MSGAMLAEMCHIRGLSSGGPRYDSTQGDPQRNQEGNLLLLCPTHHSLIDQASDKYTVDWLISIKQAHENWVKERLSIPPQPINDRQIADLSRQVAEASVDFAIVVALEKELAALLRYFPELKRAMNTESDVRSLLCCDYSNGAWWFIPHRRYSTTFYGQP